LRLQSIVVTGGNTGLGKETALRLAQLGADVVLACRDAVKGARAAADIREAVATGGGNRSGGSGGNGGNGDGGSDSNGSSGGSGSNGGGIGGGSVSSAVLDLSSLASVDAFADRFRRSKGKLDVLVNNAGVMAVPTRQLTVDGFEMTLGVNHLGHFRLTRLLMDLLAKSKDGRIVSVSSEGHKIPPGTFNFDDPFLERKYDPWAAYGQSKLANILFTAEIHRRLLSSSSAATNGAVGGTFGAMPAVTCMALHPGVCRTELGRYILDTTAAPNPLLLPLLGALAFFTKSAAEGAQTSIYCAAEPSLRGIGGGKYYARLMECAPAPPATDAAAAAQLWELSERYAGRFIV
ncbi:unnamed protein product, partial [Phaeothamnion confervicola]